MADPTSTQTARVIEHLTNVGPLTSWQAFELYGITRLSARIWDARHLGISIRTGKKTIRNRDGNHATVAVYELEA